MDKGQVDRYKDVTVKFRAHATPTLIVLDDNGKELERINLEQMTTEQIHAMMLAKGFQLKVAPPAPANARGVKTVLAVGGGGGGGARAIEGAGAALAARAVGAGAGEKVIARAVVDEAKQGVSHAAVKGADKAVAVGAVYGDGGQLDVLDADTAAKSAKSKLVVTKLLRKLYLPEVPVGLE